MSVDAAASDRLPWLSDEPQPKPVRRSGGSLMWAGAAIAAVAGAGFWLGTRSVEEQPGSPPQRGSQIATVRLPEAPRVQPEVRLPAQPEVRPSPAPEVRATPRPEVRIVPPRTRPHETVESASSVEEPVQQAPVEAAKPAPAAAPAVSRPQALPQTPFVMPRPWEPHVVAGAAGRLVEIGAFGSVPQAKLGWRYMVRSYPAMAHLPALVRPDRNSRGRIFYRFRVGTTSQAHSEVLCQRMQRIHFSCAVVGLPWKAKVER